MLNREPMHRSVETKTKLVDSAVLLMRTRGFNATSVDEICSSAGVTKGGFFYYFKSKEDIAQAALVRFRERKKQGLAAAPFTKLTDPFERVLARVEFARQVAGSSEQSVEGCLIGMFAQELSLTNPALRAACKESFAAMAQGFATDLTAAKALYAPQAAFDPQKVAFLFVSICQGSLIMAKAFDGLRVLEDNLGQFRLGLMALFGRIEDQPLAK